MKRIIATTGIILAVNCESDPRGWQQQTGTIAPIRAAIHIKDNVQSRDIQKISQPARLDEKIAAKRRGQKDKKGVSSRRKNKRRQGRKSKAVKRVKKSRKNGGRIRRRKGLKNRRSNNKRPTGLKRKYKDRIKKVKKLMPISGKPVNPEKPKFWSGGHPISPVEVQPVKVHPVEVEHPIKVVHQGRAVKLPLKEESKRGPIVRVH